jgi:hypothetical protein
MSKASVKNRIECLKNWAITYVKIKLKAEVKREEY